MTFKRAIATSLIIVVALAGVSTGLAQLGATARHTAAIEKLDPLEATAATSQVQTVKLIAKYAAVRNVYVGQVADNAVLDAFTAKEAVLRAQGIPLSDTLDTTVRRSEEHGSGWFWDLNRRSDLIDARISTLAGYAHPGVKAGTADLDRLIIAADQSHQLWMQSNPTHL